jgi:hypothetical protein
VTDVLIVVFILGVWELKKYDKFRPTKRAADRLRRGWACAQFPASVVVCSGIIRYNRRRLTQTVGRLVIIPKIGKVIIKRSE